MGGKVWRLEVLLQPWFYKSPKNFEANGYKIHSSFVVPERPKSRAIKTGTNLWFDFIICGQNVYITMVRYMILHNGQEPVLIQRLLNGFEAILEYLLHYNVTLM